MMTLPLVLAAALAADVTPTHLSNPSAGVLPTAFEPITLQDEPDGPPEWEGAVALGVSISDGNTDIQKASATADAVKELGVERYSAGFSWNYGSDNGVLTQRKTYVKGQYDHFLNEKLYWLAQVSAESDTLAGVDLRTTVGVGLGYQFRDDDEWKVSGEAGVSWFNEEFDNGAEDDYIAARLAYKWEWLHSERWNFSQDGVIFPSLEDSDDIYARLDTRAKATLTETMFAQLQWILDWDNTPAAGAKDSDNLYLLTVGWSF